MILVPMLVVVWRSQQLEARLKNETMHTSSMRPRHEVNLQCQELGETCRRILEFSPVNNDGMVGGCNDFLKYGLVCL
jgi:hypothetical protein